MKFFMKIKRLLTIVMLFTMTIFVGYSIFIADFLLLLTEYLVFFFLGIAGAIAANATGAGGGVVFVPSFKALGLTTETIIATSFAIQSIGMAVGSLSWLWFFRQKKHNLESLSLLWQVLCMSVPFSVMALILTQQLSIQGDIPINTIFSLFSLCFGVIVIYHSVYLGKQSTHRQASSLSLREKIIIALVSVVGGIITAWISVGVGEILAVFLLLMRFSVMFSVAAGVMVSCLSVWSGLPYFVAASQIDINVLLFTVPGAVIGAFLARFIAQALGAKKLKLALGSWILFVGIIGLS